VKTDKAVVNCCRRLAAGERVARKAFALCGVFQDLGKAEAKITFNTKGQPEEGERFGPTKPAAAKKNEAQTPWVVSVNSRDKVGKCNTWVPLLGNRVKGRPTNGNQIFETVLVWV